MGKEKREQPPMNNNKNPNAGGASGGLFGGRCSWCSLIPAVLVGVVVLGYLAVVAPIFIAARVPKQASVKEISAATGLNIPQNARLLNSFWLGFRDYELLAKLEMSPKEAEALMASVPKPREESRDSDLGMETAPRRQPRWWDPGSIKPFRVVKARTRNNGVATLWVLVQQGNPTQQTVYVCWITD